MPKPFLSGAVLLCQASSVPAFRASEVLLQSSSYTILFLDFLYVVSSCGHGSRHGVITRTAPWIASEDAPNGKCKSFDRAMLDECLTCIFAASGCEST